MTVKKTARGSPQGTPRTPPGLLPLLHKLLREKQTEVRRLKRALTAAGKRAAEEKARLESRIADLSAQLTEAEEQRESARTTSVAEIAAREAEVAHLREVLTRAQEDRERSERIWIEKITTLENEITRLSRALEEREEEVRILRQRESEGQRALESSLLKHSLQFPLSLLGRILAVLKERSKVLGAGLTQDLPARVTHLFHTYRDIQAHWEQGALTTQTTTDLFWKLERMAHTTRHALWEQTSRQPDVEEMLEQFIGVCNLVKKGILPFVSRHPEAPHRSSEGGKPPLPTVAVPASPPAS